jgi:putative ABC transport system permease protein
MGLLSKEYLKLIGFSFLIAVPICFRIIQWWLENFAYKMNLGFSSFLIGGLFTVIIALFAVGYQSFKAALSNPVDSIKYE